MFGLRQTNGRAMLQVMLLAFVFPGLVATAQESLPTPSPTPTASPSPMAAPLEPVYREYRGVSINMSMEEARSKLGEAKSKGPRQDFYIFSENETAQIFYRDGKVSAISADFTADGPLSMEVLGVEIKPQKSGRLYRMIRYPQAGFWVSYNRTAGKNPITTVTMRKILTKSG